MPSTDPLDDVRDWGADEILQLIDDMTFDGYRREARGQVYRMELGEDSLLGKPRGKFTVSRKTPERETLPEWLTDTSRVVID